MTRPTAFQRPSRVRLAGSRSNAVFDEVQGLGEGPARHRREGWGCRDRDQSLENHPVTPRHSRFQMIEHGLRPTLRLMLSIQYNFYRNGKALQDYRCVGRSGR